MNKKIFNKGDRVSVIIFQNSPKRMGTVVSTFVRFDRYDVELDNFDYPGTSFRYHAFKSNQIELAG